MNCQFLLQEYRKSGFKGRFGAKCLTLAKESAHLCARTQCAGVRHAKWHESKARKLGMEARHESKARMRGINDDINDDTQNDMKDDTQNGVT